MKKLFEKKIVKKLTALALTTAMLVMPAGAITKDGMEETAFDDAWGWIDAFSLPAEDDPYILQNLINRYLEKHPEELSEVLNDILSNLDSHSMYLSAAEYSLGFSKLEGFVGIGVSLEQAEEGVRVKAVIPSSPAEEAGVQEGDIFLKVDGKDVTGITYTDIVSLLRGAANTKVALVMRRQGKEVALECTRRQVNQVYVSSQTLEDGIEYIRASAFASENDWTAFAEIWNGLDEKNTRAVILDLRGNGGGVVQVALQMADLMIQEPDVYYAGIRWRQDSGGMEPHYSTGLGLPLNQMIVLVDGNTASAAELLAGSLQDTRTAMLLGTKTYGKGQGQFHVTMRNGDKLVLTTLELELPRTGTYEGEGLLPDLQLGNRVITVDTDSLKPLDTSKALQTGDQSEQVYAMTQRLAMLGLLDGAQNTFSAGVAEAVNRFRTTHDLPAGQEASPEMLQTLETILQSLQGQQIETDDQLQTALTLCQSAAARPQQYVSKPDGTWERVEVQTAAK